MKEMKAAAEEGLAALEESAGYCGLLQNSLESLTDSSLQWCHTARDVTERRAEEQLTLVEENKAAVQELLKVRDMVSTMKPQNSRRVDLKSDHLLCALAACRGARSGRGRGMPNSPGSSAAGAGRAPEGRGGADE